MLLHRTIMINLRQEVHTIALIRTEAKAESDLLRIQIASEGPSGHNEASVLRSQYESHMNQIKAVMKTEYSEQMTDAIKKSEVLQDQATRAQLQPQNVSATAEAQLYRLQAELQSQGDEQRQAQQESSMLRSDKFDMEHRLASMPTDMSTLRDRLQQKNHEMSVNNGKLHEASQQFDVEIQKASERFRIYNFETRRGNQI